MYKLAKWHKMVQYSQLDNKMSVYTLCVHLVGGLPVRQSTQDP